MNFGVALAKQRGGDEGQCLKPRKQHVQRQEEDKASEIKFRMSGGVDSEDVGGDSKLQRKERLNLQTLNVP